MASYPPPLPAHRPGRPAAPVSLLAATRLLLVVIVLMVVFQLLAHSLPLMAVLAATQWMIILPPALLYWRRRRLDPAVFARVKPLKAKFIPTIILLAASTWFVLFFAENMLLIMLAGLGFEPAVDIPAPETPAALLVYILVIAFSAGVCEEVLFRGVIMPTAERHGVVAALLFTAVLFALTHMSFLNLLSTFVLGLMIGMVVIKTGSLFAGMLYHGLNNLIAVLAMYCWRNFDPETLSESQATLAVLALLGMVALCAAGMAGGLILLQRQSIVKPLLGRGCAFFPPQAVNWATVFIALIFLGMGLLELLYGFGFFEVTAG